jgi:hypothetical protein
VKQLALLLLLVNSVFAQETPKVSAERFRVDCSMMGTAPGCKSYNEMVEANDKDILDYLKEGSALACFRENEDVFTLIAFDEPGHELYTKDLKSGLLKTFGLVFYLRFSNGLSDDFRMSPGTWTLSPNSELSAASFDANQGTPVQASVESSEVSVYYSYQNLAKTTTKYGIQIRRSTLRFTETWQYPDDEKQKGESRTTNTGHCAAFNNSPNEVDESGRSANGNVTGAYSGKVHNTTAQLWASFEIAIEEHKGHALSGCMQVHRPLYGSGKLTGDAQTSQITFSVPSSVGIIHFTGRKVGASITGTYVVQSAGGAAQNGDFELHRQGELPADFNDSGCPDDSVVH